MKPPRLIRPAVQQLHAYVPGEQPKIKGLIKLNTNENPYPPSRKVLKAIRAAVDERLRLYPNPTAQSLRESLAKRHHCSVENIIVGNGSDELLALATRAFVEPKPPGRKSRPDAKQVVQYFTPSYSLYPVLADIHGAIRNPVPLQSDFGIPAIAALRRERRWNFRAALTLVTTPNAPSGRGYSTLELESLCKAQRGVIILDEAYVDFADDNAMELATRYPNVLVSRTFSKAYSLCFQRIGYCVGHPDLVAALDKIRDSYNVNGLAQIAALATLQDLPYYYRNFERVKATRQWLVAELSKVGFVTLPSQTNFILTRPSGPPARDWLEKLRNRRILVRWFGHPELSDQLRISIGTQAEAKAMVVAAQRILSSCKEKAGPR